MTRSCIILLAIAMALSGCGKRITNENIDALNQQLDRVENAAARDGKIKGISPKEVESVLGQPTRVETFKIPLETQKPLLDGARYYYTQDGETVVVHFVDNKLISRVPHWSGGDQSGNKPAK
jgi:hypothetical protein